MHLKVYYSKHQNKQNTWEMEVTKLTYDFQQFITFINSEEIQQPGHTVVLGQKHVIASLENKIWFNIN